MPASWSDLSPSDEESGSFIVAPEDAGERLDLEAPLPGELRAFLDVLRSG
jgi:hypothetical protein